ncbi:MAG: hypothetical protein R3B72_49675 [Polyangiaceae bacterium]
MSKKPTFGIVRPTAAAEAKALESFVTGLPSPPDEAESPREEVSSKVAVAKTRPKKSGASKAKTTLRSDGSEVRRLTIYLPPELYLECKVHAAGLDRSLSEWIGDLVRAELAN